MRLLFDENVSHRLVHDLAKDYRGSAHVRDIGLRASDDQAIWDFAIDQGFIIVSKDTDFREHSFVDGAPPKVIWLDVGNSGTSAISDLLRRERERVEVFQNSEELSMLILSIDASAV
jgi:predicted nuclease of predicted toxin-antitoxin system